MFFTCLFIGQILKVEICFNKNGLDLKCNGVHFHYIAGQFVIFALLAVTGKSAPSVNNHLHHFK